MVPEVMPQFEGGPMRYIQSIIYPAQAVDYGLEGTVFVRFVVEKDGSVGRVSIARSSTHKILDQAATQHLEKMPKWTPGEQNGRPVPVQYVVPVKFKLR